MENKENEMVQQGNQSLAAESDGQQQSEGPAADSDYASDMGTLFILDLLKQKREKLMRLKKDEMINEMARKQREKMENHRRQQQQGRGGGGGVSDGTGFMGVHTLLNQPKKYDWRTAKKQREEEEETAQQGSS